MTTAVHRFESAQSISEKKYHSGFYAMSLYYEAAQVLDSAQKDGGSIKSLVFSKQDRKSDPKALFALSTEASKWSEILAEVIENSGVLKAEKQVRTL